MRTLHRVDGADWADEDLGEWLVDRVRSAVERGPAPSTAVAVREDRIDLIPLGDVVREGIRPNVFVATLTRAEVPFAGVLEAVGVIGEFRWRSRHTPDGLPVATVFLEWSDCRWWHWRAALGPDRDVLDESSAVSRAVDGGPRPAGLGGWWSLGRRARLGARFEPREQPVVH